MFDPKQLDAMLGDDPQSQFLAAIGLHPAQKAIRETLGNELHGQAAPQVVQKPDVAPGAPPIESSAIPAVSPGASPTAASGAPASPTGLKAGIAAPDAEATEHPAVNVPKVSGIEQNKAELQRQITTGSGISQIKNPFLRTLARVGDIAGTAMFPAVTAAIPGTELHHRIGIHNLEHDIGQQEGASKSEADTRESNANANRLEHPEDQVPKSPEGQVFKSLVDGGVPPLEAYKLVHPETRETPEAKAFDAALKANGGDAIKAYQQVKDAGREPVKVAPEAAAFARDHGKHVEDLTFEDYKAIASAMHPKQFQINTGDGGKGPLVSVPQPDGTNKVVRLREGDTMPKGAKTINEVTGETKVTADEQRRGDLARNMDENLSALEDIARRRPELFGPLAGRLSELRQKFGTDDPDLAALATIKEQMGMAMVGAHAMRNAQHVEAAADAILNGMKNDPKALLDPTNGSIARARKSLETFKRDADPNKGSAAATSDAMVTVQIPGQPAGKIPKSRLKDFQKKYPNATVTQ